MSEPTGPLRQWDRELVWHAFTQMAEYEPLIFVEGRGATLVDDTGRELLDGVSSLWCNVHGHRHPRLDAAIREQLDRVAHVTMLGASTPSTIELAHRLSELTPDGLRHTFFSSDGSAAIEVGLKLAFQYWQQRPDPRPEKTKYIALGGAYHGDTLGSVSVGGVARFHEMFRPLLFEVERLDCPDAWRLPPAVEPDQAAAFYLAELESLLAREHPRIAAMVMEPLIQCAAGMVKHPPGYLAGVRELTRRYDVLLIADEVATGFGRTGRMFACEHEQVAPDLLCLGKGLTGGYLPMAATVATDEIWNAFLGEYHESRHFFHGHTYSGNALSAAVALATLEVFEEERTLERIQPRIEQLGSRLEELRYARGVGDVRQLGLIGAIELCVDVAGKIPFPWTERRGQRVCDYARSKGVFLRPLGSVIVVMPPLCITESELDRILDAVAEGIEYAVG
ncbi:MAG: adenosylmethionine--8-amino-7-oxononanoate transaminase [Planctomycetales bacterium]|nr:adenosylmethionine--8-amino-7-oxononanoate transaminase [Planctomycetales bacterium]